MPRDYYATVVSSQFDADRLDYLQRDRQMTGVEFGHLDSDWLFDCLEVGSITIDSDDPVEVPCLYLNFKGVHVAEEYLQARSRLYTMVYMHKTTRAAEKMLSALLDGVRRDLESHAVVRQDPMLRHLSSNSMPLGSYLDLDDATVWSTLSAVVQLSPPHPLVSDLARRLRDRRLYKCFDIGIQDSSDPICTIASSANCVIVTLMMDSIPFYSTMRGCRLTSPTTLKIRMRSIRSWLRPEQRIRNRGTSLMYRASSVRSARRNAFRGSIHRRGTE